MRGNRYLTLARMQLDDTLGLGRGSITGNPEVAPFLVREGWPTTRPETGIAGKSLFDALPQKLKRRILSVNHSPFPVLAGDKE